MLFTFAFGVKVVIPVKIEMPCAWVQLFEEHSNDTKLSTELDLLEERRDDAALKAATYQQRAICYYNNKVIWWSFNASNLVLWKVTLNTKKAKVDSLEPIEEGSYKVIKIIRLNTYNLEDSDGRVLKHLWNVEHLRHYY